MSTPDAPNTDPQQGATLPPPPARPPYGGPPAPPPAAPQYPAAPQNPAAQQYPAAPQDPAAQQYPGVQQYATGQPYPAAPEYAPQYGAPGVYGNTSKPSNGTLSWAMGFLIFIFIPFLSGIISGVVMAAVYGSVSRKGEIARQNARSAANWALTYLTVSIAMLLLHVILLATFASNGGVRDFFPLGIPITLYFAVSLLHVVLVIVGTVKASGGKVLRVPFSIPYIRS